MKCAASVTGVPLVLWACRLWTWRSLADHSLAPLVISEGDAAETVGLPRWISLPQPPTNTKVGRHKQGSNILVDQIRNERRDPVPARIL